MGPAAPGTGSGRGLSAVGGHPLQGDHERAGAAVNTQRAAELGQDFGYRDSGSIGASTISTNAPEIGLKVSTAEAD